MYELVDWGFLIQPVTSSPILIFFLSFKILTISSLCWLNIFFISSNWLLLFCGFIPRNLWSENFPSVFILFNSSSNILIWLSFSLNLATKSYFSGWESSRPSYKFWAYLATSTFCSWVNKWKGGSETFKEFAKNWIRCFNCALSVSKSSISCCNILILAL